MDGGWLKPLEPTELGVPAIVLGPGTFLISTRGERVGGTAAASV